MLNLGAVRSRFWRGLIGIAVAYAVATQSLLIGFALSLSANAAQGAPAFELCHHEAQDVPQPPAGGSGCTHCILCSGGSQFAVLDSPPVLFLRVDLTVIEALWAANEHCLPNRSAYSTASPRGPPLSA